MHNEYAMWNEKKNKQEVSFNIKISNVRMCTFSSQQVNVGNFKI